MKTITIDIINEKAIKLLQDLEILQLIRMHKEKTKTQTISWNNQYKGAMSKQPIAEIDNQLDELRNGWE